MWLPAKLGQDDDSKKHINYRTERPDPKDPEGWIETGVVRTNSYQHEVDWKSATSVRKLNAWREQLFRRAFGQARPVRHFVRTKSLDLLLNISTSMLLIEGELTCSFAVD